MSYSVDVNVLLYASNTNSALHEHARSFLASCRRSAELFYLTWPTIMGYLRIATHRRIFTHPLTQAEAEANVRALLDLPQVQTLAEGAGFWDVYADVSTECGVVANLVPDAHLVAILKQHGIKTLYTHDRDFRKFDFIEAVDPFTI